MLQFLVTANVIPSSLIICTLMMEAICSPETSVLTRATLYHIPEDDILHSHCQKILNLFSMMLTNYIDSVDFIHARYEVT
jgi:hypothetical protein